MSQEYVSTVDPLNKQWYFRIGDKCGESVLQFSVGNPSFVDILMTLGKKVFIVEPSAQIRSDFSKNMPESICMINGDTIDCYLIDGLTFHTVINTNSFPYLNNNEKAVVLDKYCNVLSSSGNIIYLDKFEGDVYNPAYVNLLQQNGFRLMCTQVNDTFWVVEATKE